MLSKKTRQSLVDDFIEDRDYACYNIAHIVLDDDNLDDESIHFAINNIDETREEYKRDNEEVTDSDIDETRAFLVSLLDIPYSEDRDNE